MPASPPEQELNQIRKENRRLHLRLLGRERGYQALFSLAQQLQSDPRYLSPERITPLLERYEGGFLVIEPKGLLAANSLGLELTEGCQGHPLGWDIKQQIQATKGLAKNGVFEAHGKAGFWEQAVLVPLAGDRQLVCLWPDLSETQMGEITASEASLRTIFNSVHDGIFIHDLDGNLLDINEPALKLFGLNSKERALRLSFIGDYSASSNPLERLPTLWQKALGGHSTLLQWKARRPGDGSLFDAEIAIGSLILHGQPAIMINLRDITSEQTTWRDLAQTQANIESILESQQEPIWAVDSQFRFLVFNSYFKAVYKKLFQVEAQPGVSFLHPMAKEEANFWRERLTQSLGGVKLNLEYSVTLAGEKRVFEVTLNPIHQQNQFIGVTAFGQDITTRIELDQQKERQKTFLRNLIDTDPNLIFVKDKEGRFIEANRAVAQLYGADVESLIGKLDSELADAPADIFRLYEADLKVLEHEQPFFIPEEKLKNHYGEDLWVQSIKVPLADETGKFNQVLTVATDITTRKRAEKRMFEAKTSAEKANQAKSEFLANMSHEIRTPLNAILGFAEILRSQIRDERYQEYLHSIDSAGKTLLSLINDILDLSKVEAGKLHLQLGPTDLNQVIYEVTQIFNQRILDKGLELYLIIDPLLPNCLRLDEIRIRQVLLNLMGNAVKFTESGYIKVEIKVESAFTDLFNLLIMVEDTGVGIEDKQLDLIFKAFEQQPGQSNAKYGGTGLGLAISRRLVEMMNGQITATHNPEGGARFVLRLSEARRVPDSEVLAQSPTKIDPSNLVFKPSRVLVVDDVRSNRQLIHGFLPYPELTLADAADGLEAIKQAELFPPDLVLMDLKMPNMDGYKALEALRKIPGLEQTPVIAVTASVMKYEEVRLQTIFTDVLPKPLTRNSLLTCVSRYLEHKLDHTATREVSGTARQHLSKADLVVLEAFNSPEAARSYLDRCAYLKRSLTINEIEIFALSIKELAEIQGAENLILWASGLAQACDLFSLQEITENLEELEKALGLLSLE